MNWTPADLAAYESRQLGKPEPVHALMDATPDGQEDSLHVAIADYCQSHNWMFIHTRMDKRSPVTPGTPDFIIFASRGRTLLIECKTRTGKLSQDQTIWNHCVERQGHTVHVVRSVGEFLEVVRDPDQNSRESEIRSAEALCKSLVNNQQQRTKHANKGPIWTTAIPILKGLNDEENKQ